MENYKIYIHTSPSNKVYIGITMQDEKKRWSQRYNHNRYFTNAINKHGWNNFKHEVILCNLTKEQADMFEVGLIKYYKSNIIEYGYNISNGGDGRGKHTEETKLKISKAHTGKKLKESTKIKLSKIKMGSTPWNKGKKYKTGYICPEETKKKIRESMLGKNSKPLSEEHKDKIRKGMYKLYKSVLNITTGQIFESLYQAAKYYNIDASTISKVCRGKKSTCGGYKWQYIESISS